jgi:hypothetical protein
MVDSLGQQRHLHVRRAGVLAMQLKLVNRLRLRFHIFYIRVTDASYPQSRCKALSQTVSSAKMHGIQGSGFAFLGALPSRRRVDEEASQ